MVLFGFSVPRVVAECSCLDCVNCSNSAATGGAGSSRVQPSFLEPQLSLFLNLCSQLICQTTARQMTNLDRSLPKSLPHSAKRSAKRVMLIFFVLFFYYFVLVLFGWLVFGFFVVAYSEYLAGIKQKFMVGHGISFPFHF